MEISERDAEFAVNQLKELADNLAVATDIVKMAGRAGLERGSPPEEVAPFFRMSFSWIAISLYKIGELWQRFGRLASDVHKNEMRALLNEIRDRGVEDFRNKVAAHLLDRDTKNPLSPEELTPLAMKMMRNDMPGFFSWLHRFDDPGEKTVTSTLLAFRADILRTFPNVRITA